jgi:hypothetical protein
VLLHQLFLGLLSFWSLVGSTLELLYRVLGCSFIMCVAIPPKLTLSYFIIVVFLVRFCPELFIRDVSRPPNSPDVSQAPINERLQFSLNLICVGVCPMVVSTDYGD